MSIQPTSSDQPTPPPVRRAEVHRQTHETDIRVTLDLDTPIFLEKLPVSEFPTSTRDDFAASIRQLHSTVI